MELPPHRPALALLVGLFVLHSPVARGQPPAHTQTRAVLADRDTVVRLSTTWSADDEQNGATVLAGNGAPTVLHRGSSVVGALGVGHGRILIALVVNDARRPLRVHGARVENGAIEIGDAIDVRRASGRHLPFAVAVATVPDGFAVFFQEVEERDPTAAHTYLVRLAPDGSPRGEAREAPIPWSLAAAAWNGHGFHLGLVFPGYGDGMRLSMVSVTADGTPEQHPDWASAAGIVDDVHLVARDGRITAFYRGAAGDRLLESDVTTVRGWGTEPPRARDHGPLAPSEIIAVEAAAAARPRAVSARAE